MSKHVIRSKDQNKKSNRFQKKRTRSLNTIQVKQNSVKTNKKWLVLTILILLIGIAIGVYYFFVPKTYIYQQTSLCNEKGYCVERNTKKPITGIVKGYYSNNQLKSSINYEEGIPNGLSRVYYENGNIMLEIVFTNGKRWHQKKYYENGNLMSEAFFNEEKLNGPLTEYYENGKIKMEAYFQNDEPDGIYKDYYQNGQLKTKGRYKNGLIDGAGESYYPNGQIKIRDYYKNNIKDGYDEKYYENGLLKQKGIFKNGKQDGVVVRYDRSGNIYQIITLKNKRPNGLFVEYYKTGQIHKKAYFHDGNGSYEIYTEDGELYETRDNIEAFLYDEGNFVD